MTTPDAKCTSTTCSAENAILPVNRYLTRKQTNAYQKAKQQKNRKTPKLLLYTHKHTNSKYNTNTSTKQNCISHAPSCLFSHSSKWKCVKVQCHVSFQTEAGEKPNASPETSTDRAKTQGEEQSVPTLTPPGWRSVRLPSHKSIYSLPISVRPFSVQYDNWKCKQQPITFSKDDTNIGVFYFYSWQDLSLT